MFVQWRFCWRLWLSILSCLSLNSMLIVLHSTSHSGTSPGHTVSPAELSYSCLVLQSCLPLGRRRRALNTVRSRDRTDAAEITARYCVPYVVRFLTRCIYDASACFCISTEPYSFIRCLTACSCHKICNTWLLSVFNLVRQMLDRPK